jgi:FlaA1/EpsC-like NDP-sugar epimerase
MGVPCGICARVVHAWCTLKTPHKGRSLSVMYNMATTLARSTKRGILLCVDIILVPPALLTAMVLQYDDNLAFDNMLQHWQALPLLMGLCGLLTVVLGLHRVQLKAFESHAIGLTALHAVLLGLATAVMDDLAGFGTSFATFINFALIYFFMSIGVRMLMLQVLLEIYRREQPQCRLLIYGAGQTGRQLAAALRTDQSTIPVAFIDDNEALQTTLVQGLTVYSPLTIEALVKARKIDRVVLAMPSMTKPRQAHLSRHLRELGLDVHTVPSFAQLTGQTPVTEEIQSGSADKLLRRRALDNELSGGSDAYRGRVVLISGAGGSIGSELCRQIASCAPKRIVLFEISELALYRIDMELRGLARNRAIHIVPVLGSVTDENLVLRTLRDHDVQVVLHAAAYKHVNLVEQNPITGMANNVLGTHVLARAASTAQVERFILISTDKAVRPTNIMGASKRLAEMLVHDLANRTKGGNIFSIVRFGNVMGSSGSVIPLFQEQIKLGGPVTVTHPDVTRYFMTISEAARLVLVAGSFDASGDVFVLDMGEPVRIYDLACQMISAVGYSLRNEANPNGDIEIKFIGLQPGEKIEEELLIGKGQTTTAHPKILQANETHLSEIEVASAMRSIRDAIERADETALRAVIARWVEGGAHFTRQAQDTSRT